MCAVSRVLKESSTKNFHRTGERARGVSHANTEVYELIFDELYGRMGGSKKLAKFCGRPSWMAQNRFSKRNLSFE